MALIPALAVLISGSPSAQALGLIVVDEAHWQPAPGPPEMIPPGWPHPPRPPRPIPPPRSFRPHVFTPLHLESCKADVQIRDQVAVTRVKQEFHNPNAHPVEGTFLFPVPKGAQLDRFAIEIDGHPVEAELLDADKARRLYEDIVRRAKDPALMEYEGQDAFKVRLFPIDANARRQVTVRYTQWLKLDSGLIQYTLPLNTAKYSSQPIKTLSVKADIESPQPLSTLYSPSHAVEIGRDGGRHATIGYEGSDVKTDTDFTLFFSADPAAVGIRVLTHRDDRDKDGFFLLLASPGVEVAHEKVVPKDVIFVLDTSGSMAGGKLEQAKNALRFCIDNLNDNDRFEIIRFSTEVDPLFGAVTAADRSNRDRAARFVDKLKPIGGTAIDAALKKALASRVEEAEGRPCAVIFLTDGLPTVGVTSENRILDNVMDRSGEGVRVFCFGIGTDVNTHLLDKIAELTRATSQYVLPDEDLEVKLSNFYSKIKDPLLANPELRFEGRPHVSRLHPSELPDLFRGEQLVVVGRYAGAGKVGVALEGTVNSTKRVFESNTRLPQFESRNDFIPRLWANRRVGFLLDQIRLHGQTDELRDEVIELARQYGIVTPYTAYLILEDEEQRRVPRTAQLFPQLHQEGLARDQIRYVGVHYGKEVAGDLAVNAARANSSIRSAASLDAASRGAEEAAEAIRFTPVTPPAAGLAAAAPAPPSAPLEQPARFVGGRTFYFNNGRWIDSQMQRFPEADRVKLQFGSDAYFQFAATNADARAWLAQGANVEFVLDGTIYVVEE